MNQKPIPAKAVSSCVKCGNKQFEATQITTINTKVAYTSIQCNSCGAVVGISDIVSLNNVLAILQKAIQGLG